MTEKANTLPTEEQLIEALANLEHERWSGWERYRATMSASPDRLLNKHEVRWRDQRETPYTELPENHKESDRVEARKTIAMLRELGALKELP